MADRSSLTRRKANQYDRFLRAQELEEEGHYLEAAIAYESAGAARNAKAMRERLVGLLALRARPAADLPTR